MEYEIVLPSGELSQLKAGDAVLLSGSIYTARDAAHQRLHELLQKGEDLPFSLQGNGIYYVGPTPNPLGEVIGAAGPTTSGRMDRYTPELLDLGLKVMVGKGRRSSAVKEAVVRNKAVYLGALGGGGALMASHIKEVEIICWEDLGCEAVRRLTLDKLPLTVVLDCHGGDLYEEGPQAYLQSLH